MSYTVGSTLTGFSLIFFMPKLDSLFEWIDYHEEEILAKIIYVGILPADMLSVPSANVEEIGDVS
jgi:hypothetical protein